MFIYLDMGGEAGSVRGRGDRERPRFPPSCAAGSHLRLQQVGDGDGDFLEFLLSSLLIPFILGSLVMSSELGQKSGLGLI